jgi:hypothetical protein
MKWNPIISLYSPVPRQREQYARPLPPQALHQLGHSPFGSISKCNMFVLPLPWQQWQSTLPLPSHTTQGGSGFFLTFLRTFDSVLTTQDDFLIDRWGNELWDRYCGKPSKLDASFRTIVDKVIVITKPINPSKTQVSVLSTQIKSETNKGYLLTLDFQQTFHEHELEGTITYSLHPLL